MRYISDIVTAGGHVDGLMYVSLMQSGLVYVEVTDSGKDLCEEFASDALHNVDCYGVSLAGGVIVRHTAKTAALHRFVDSAWTVGINPEVDLYCNDYIEVATGVRSIGDHKSLVVNTFEEDIRIVGRQGSAVVRQSKVRGTRDAMTLYDALGYLCKELEVNLMSYDSVMFYSEMLCYEAKVSFVHNQEADRYFTKMYYDISGGGRRDAICVRSSV